MDVLNDGKSGSSGRRNSSEYLLLHLMQNKEYALAGHVQRKFQPPLASGLISVWLGQFAILQHRYLYLFSMLPPSYSDHSISHSQRPFPQSMNQMERVAGAGRGNSAGGVRGTQKIINLQFYDRVCALETHKPGLYAFGLVPLILHCGDKNMSSGSGVFAQFGGGGVTRLLKRRARHTKLIKMAVGSERERASWIAHLQRAIAPATCSISPVQPSNSLSLSARSCLSPCHSRAPTRHSMTSPPLPPLPFAASSSPESSASLSLHQIRSQSEQLDDVDSDACYDRVPDGQQHRRGEEHDNNSSSNCTLRNEEELLEEPHTSDLIDLSGSTSAGGGCSVNTAIESKAELKHQLELLCQEMSSSKVATSSTSNHPTPLSYENIVEDDFFDSDFETETEDSDHEDGSDAGEKREYDEEEETSKKTQYRALTQMLDPLYYNAQPANIISTRSSWVETAKLQLQLCCATISSQESRFLKTRCFAISEPKEAIWRLISNCHIAGEFFVTMDSERSSHAGDARHQQHQQQLVMLVLEKPGLSVRTLFIQNCGNSSNLRSLPHQHTEDDLITLSEPESSSNRQDCLIITFDPHQNAFPNLISLIRYFQTHALPPDHLIRLHSPPSSSAS